MRLKTSIEFMTEMLFWINPHVADFEGLIGVSEAGKVRNNSCPDRIRLTESRTEPVWHWMRVIERRTVATY